MRLHWSASKAQRSSQTMFDKMFYMKFLPPGRGLFMAGTKFIEENNDSTPLYNCSFVSTEGIKDEGTLSFTFGMSVLFMGTGLGFDTRGAGKMKIKKPHGKFVYTIGDSREEWTNSLDLLLQSYFYGKRMPEFDYSKIRVAGLPLKRFGGTSSGPGPLKELHEAVIEICEKRIGEFLTSVDIVDIFNLIGRCVVAGSVRRSAEVAIGDPDDEDFLSMKDFNKFPKEVANHRWLSNKHNFSGGW